MFSFFGYLSEGVSGNGEVGYSRNSSDPPRTGGVQASWHFLMPFDFPQALDLDPTATLRIKVDLDPGVCRSTSLEPFWGVSDSFDCFMIVNPGAFCAVVFFVHRHYLRYSDRLLATDRTDSCSCAIAMVANQRSFDYTAIISLCRKE
jgi:hypothetical protein